MTKWLVAVNVAYFHDISMTSTAVLSNCGWIQDSALGVSAEDPRWVVEDLDQRGDESEISPTNLGRCSCLKNHIWDDPNDPRVFSLALQPISLIHGVQMWWFGTCFFFPYNIYIYIWK
jgi:hypothetical protein